jgi:hypothetical protein
MAGRVEQLDPNRQPVAGSEHRGVDVAHRGQWRVPGEPTELTPERAREQSLEVDHDVGATGHRVEVEVLRQPPVGQVGAGERGPAEEHHRVGEVA